MPDIAERDPAGSRGRSQGEGWVPIPDPTTLTTEAVERATQVFRREIMSLRETIETRLDGFDQNRGLIWDRLRELPELYEVAAGHLRDEVLGIASHNREVLTQRLNDLDTAARLATEHIERIPADNQRDAAALANDFKESMRSEREFMLSRIDLANAATGKVSEVMLEKFGAVASTCASNALALTAALAAQKEAAAEANKSAALAISKSEAATQETIKSNSAQTQTGQQALSDTLTDVKERVVRIESTGAGASASRNEAREVNSQSHMSAGTTISIVVAAVGILSLLIGVISLLAAHKL